MYALFLLRRIVKVGAQEFHSALNCVLGVIPRLVAVSVIEFFAEPADVFAQLLHIFVYDLAAVP
jgi:hypothetical protein